MLLLSRLGRSAEQTGEALSPVPDGGSSTHPELRQLLYLRLAMVPAAAPVPWPGHGGADGVGPA